MKTKWRDLDDFTQSYIVCALWSSNDESDESGGEPLDKNYDYSDIAEESMIKIMEDCKKFQAENAKDIELYPSDAGHDFWLSRNHHGAGFFSGDWPEEVGERLQEVCRKWGEVNPYVGDDGQIYFN